MTEPHPDLFGGYPDAPGWKRTDTSRDAAKAVATKATTLREQVLEILKLGDATTMQIAHAMRRPFSSIQPRTSELREKGLIFDSGKRGISRDCTKLAIVWTVTEPDTTRNDASACEGGE